MPILAAVDGNEASKEVVEVGYDLATRYDQELVVLHVIPQAEYERQQDSSPEFTLDRAEGSARDAAQTVVVDAIGETEGVTARGEVGDVEQTLLDVAEDIDAQYLVVGSRQKSPVGKAVFGSTTQAVLLDAACPVVSVALPEV